MKARRQRKVRGRTEDEAGPVERWREHQRKMWKR